MLRLTVPTGNETVSLSLSLCMKLLPPRYKDFPKVLRNQQLFTMQYSHHQHLLDPAVLANAFFS